MESKIVAMSAGRVERTFSYGTRFAEHLDAAGSDHDPEVILGPEVAFFAYIGRAANEVLIRALNPFVKITVFSKGGQRIVVKGVMEEGNVRPLQLNGSILIVEPAIEVFEHPEAEALFLA